MIATRSDRSRLESPTRTCRETILVVLGGRVPAISAARNPLTVVRFRTFNRADTGFGLRDVVETPAVFTWHVVCKPSEPLEVHDFTTSKRVGLRL